MFLDRARDVLCVSATQVGKTYLLAAWLLARALAHPSRVHPYWWLAPTYNQIVQGFRLVSGMAHSADVLESPPVMTPYPVLRFISGGMIEFRSWEREQNLMGTTIAGGVVDEAGLLTPEAQAAISTRRSSTLGPLRYIGNPGVMAGPFRKLCSLGEQARIPGNKWAGVYGLHRWTWQDKRDALALESVGMSREYAAFIEQERESLPDFEFRRLYDAEWTEDEAAVFRNVHECVDGTHTMAPGSDSFVLGVDVGQVVDYMAVVSMAKQTRRIDLRDRFRGVSFPQAAERVKAISERLNAPVVLEVNNQGVALQTEFDRIGVRYIPFTTTNQSKQEIILSLAADVQSKRVSIGDHAPMPYEFATFRYERTPSGLYRYGAPVGEHDDTVMAAALARWGIGRAVDLSDWGWVA